MLLGHKTFGPQVDPDGSILGGVGSCSHQYYHLTGEFNSWDRSSPPFRKPQYKRWEPVLPSMEGKTAINQGEKVKIQLCVPSH